MIGTGLTQQQYDLLQKILWPSEDEEDTTVEEFLEKITTPEELHQLALNHNLDDGYGIPDWIISQPFCDRGTALLIYWRTDPQWFHQYSSKDGLNFFEEDGYELIKEIENRFLAGFYTQQNIAYDPRNDEGSDFTHPDLEYKLIQDLPSVMRNAVSGKVLERASFY